MLRALAISSCPAVRVRAACVVLCFVLGDVCGWVVVLCKRFRGRQKQKDPPAPPAPPPPP